MYSSKAKVIGSALNGISHVWPRIAIKIAWKFFCTPLGAKVKAHQKQILLDAKYKTFDQDGTSLQAFRWGNGPRNIVFLHGWASNSFRWRHYISKFPLDEFSIYTIDAPAHGFSTGSIANVLLFKSALRLLIDDIGKVDTIVGHSVGGMATVFYLHEYQGAHIDNCIIMAAPGEVKDFVTYFCQTLGLNGKLHEAINQYFITHIGFESSHFSASKFAKSITTKALIIHDKEDQEAPYYYADKLHRSWVDSELLTTEGLGHHLRDEQIYNKVREYIL
jgi:pimeloyl-ACP methyl ester carboxylesterase